MSSPEYMRDYMLNRYRKRMALAKEKLGGKCVSCGVASDLQLDHVDPSTKSFTIGRMSSCSEEKFWTEVAKCQLLCEPCHIVKTLQDKGLKSARGTHGTLSSYRYCRCERCKAAMADYYRKKRALSSVSRAPGF